MRSIGCLFVILFVCNGCMLDRSPIPASYVLPDAAVDWPDAVTVRPDAACPLPDPDPEPLWPRSHPAGTLLIDHERQLWMVGEHGTRLQVSGDDTLSLVNLDDGDATPMTREEERCLIPLDEDWTVQSENWWPVFGPEDDPGPYFIDTAAAMRYPVSMDALKSYGFLTDWIDDYDDPLLPWSELNLGPQVGIRDGTLVHTEYGFAYVTHGRSFYFRPNDLVAAAGYHPESAIWITDRRLRELAPLSVSIDHDSFDFCPADSGSP